MYLKNLKTGVRPADIGVTLLPGNLPTHTAGSHPPQPCARSSPGPPAPRSAPGSPNQ